MKKLVIAALASLALVPMGAAAQERGGDAALGAISGAVVLGPVGAVAGALIGYTAGPSIARSWGMRRSASRPRHATQSSVGTREQEAAKASPPPAVKMPETVASIKVAPPAAKTPETVASTKSAPPVQGFD